MDVLEEFKNKAKSNLKKIVFPEGNDERILEAVSKVKEQGLAIPIILGNSDDVLALAKEYNIDLSDIEIINNKDQDKIDVYAKEYIKDRDLKEVIAKKLVKKALFFGGMMVKTGEADGMVAGVANATASVIQAASLTVGFKQGMSTPSSFFIMVLPEFNGEENKIFIFADCAVNINPNAKQLADIGVSSGINTKALLGMEPKIAFLSCSTKGSASHDDIDKVTEAVKIAKEIAPDFLIDGELQGDAAIIEKVATKKVKDSNGVAGSANVLVFPDLDAGNIAYKLVQYMGKAKAIGPILQGFDKPVNDMSRGASVDDLVNVTAITAVQAQG